MSTTVILGAARTPFGKLGGALASFDATDLGGKAIAAALERAEVEPDKVQKVGRNDPCWCGSGKKYKKCHGA